MNDNISQLNGEIKHPVLREQIIHCEFWYRLCDYKYTQQNYLPTGVVHVSLGAIPEFFARIKNNKEKYIVISSREDFGLCYQAQFPPWLDIGKAGYIFARPEHSYSTFMVPPRVDLKTCNPTDKYSIKCYCYTKATFDEIPSNVVHWFVTNCMINDDPRITAIPFGINCTKQNFDALDLICNIEIKKDKKPLYVNFTFNTYERVELFKYYSTCQFTTVKKDLSGKEYLEDVAEHAFVLCPNGNGIDCYRTWEALYLGAIPIIEVHPGTFQLLQHKLPMISSATLYLNYLTLDYIYKKLKDLPKYYEAATIDFWQHKINNAKELLHKA